MKNRALLPILALCALSWPPLHAQESPDNPPFQVVPCNLNCLDKGHVQAVPPTADPAADQGKHRVIVLTDMGADNDDSQSMVRLLLYSNEIDIEGLVATTSTFMMDRTNVWLIEKPVDAYAKVHANLVKHDPNYPTAEHLRSLIKSGSPLYGMGGVGPGKDSEGSALIISQLKSSDSRPSGSLFGAERTFLPRRFGSCVQRKLLRLSRHSWESCASMQLEIRTTPVSGCANNFLRCSG